MSFSLPLALANSDRMRLANNILLPMVPCERAPPKQRRARQSDSLVWEEGSTWAARDAPAIVRGWKCRRCEKIVPLHNGAPSNAQKHLRNAHGIILDKTSRTTPSEVDGDDWSSMTSSPQPSRLKIPVPQQQAQLVVRPNIPLFRTSILEWYLQRHLPFDSVEDPAFRRAIIAANAGMKEYLFGRDAMRNWAKEEYVVAKNKIKELLLNTLSKIHVSFDIWTSPYSTYAFLGVCAHFIIEREGKTVSQSTLLALRRMHGDHSGENIAKVLREVLIEFEIVDKVGVFIADNASNNDTAIKELLQTKDISNRRARCLGHILNLAAKSFIFGKDPDLFLKQVVHEGDIMTAEQVANAQVAWRTKGALGKLHNLIIYIRSSPQRKEAFRQCMVDDIEVDSKWCAFLV